MNQNNEYPPVTLEMVKKLREVYDNDNFIIAVYADVHDREADQQKIIDFINAGDDVDHETVSVLAMDLADLRDGKK